MSRYPLNPYPFGWSPLARAVAAADFASGISWVLPFGPYHYTNADLTLYLHRPPISEWIGVDAVTRIDTPGIGLTTTRLLDHDGLVGGPHQTLVVRRGAAPILPSVEPLHNRTP